MLKFLNLIKKFTGLFDMTNDKALTFNKISKTIANTSYEGAFTQSIVVFHQEIDSDTMFLLNDDA